MFAVLRSIIGIVILVAVIYLVSNYFGLAQETVGVKGASTEKAQEVSRDIQSDISKQADKAADGASNITVGEIIGFFNRFQKIPEDVQNVRTYAEEQIDNVTKRDK